MRPTADERLRFGRRARKAARLREDVGALAAHYRRAGRGERFVREMLEAGAATANGNWKALGVPEWDREWFASAYRHAIEQAVPGEP